MPIVNASTVTLRDRLEELVAMGPAGREEIGQASRAYVEHVHDLERVTDRLLDLYQTVLEPARTRHAPTVAPAGPATDLPPALPLGDTEPATAPDAEVSGCATADRRAVRARQPAPAPRPTLGDLRDRWPRLARHRRPPAPRLHALPDAG